MYLRLFYLIFFLLLSFYSYSQTGIIKGKVLGEKGEVIENATINIADTKLQTVTDKNGNYSITVPSDTELKCLIRILGYRETNFTFNLKAG